MGEGVHVALFPINITVVPLFPKNKLKCSRLLSSHVPRNCAPSFLDPLKYSSVLPTISLTFHFNFRLLERGYLAIILRKYLSERKFANGKTTLQQRNNSARKKNFYLLLHNTTRLYLACRECGWRSGTLCKTSNG